MYKIYFTAQVCLKSVKKDSARMKTIFTIIDRADMYIVKAHHEIIITQRVK